MNSIITFCENQENFNPELYICPGIYDPNDIIDSLSIDQLAWFFKCVDKYKVPYKNIDLSFLSSDDMIRIISDLNYSFNDGYRVFNLDICVKDYKNTDVLEFLQQNKYHPKYYQWFCTNLFDLDQQIKIIKTTPNEEKLKKIIDDVIKNNLLEDLLLKTIKHKCFINILNYIIGNKKLCKKYFSLIDDLISSSEPEILNTLASGEEYEIYCEINVSDFSEHNKKSLIPKLIIYYFVINQNTCLLKLNYYLNDADLIFIIKSLMCAKQDYALSVIKILENKNNITLHKIKDIIYKYNLLVRPYLLEFLD